MNKSRPRSRVQQDEGILLVELMPLRRPRLHPNGAFSFALDRDETMVASAGFDQTVRNWDRKTGKNKATFDAPPAALGPLAFSPDGKILACCYSRTPATGPTSVGYGFLIYEVSSGKVLEEIEAHRGGIRTLAFSPDGKLLATAGYESFIRLWIVPAAWRKKGK